MPLKMPEIDNQAVKKWFQGKYPMASKVILLLVVTSIMAKILSTIIVLQLADLALPASQDIIEVDLFAQAERFNYRNLRKAILDRNLFNRSGELPPDSDENENAGAGSVESFNLSGPCRDTALSITLIGTIFTGQDATNLATIQEKGIGSPDIYRVGDMIIGSEAASIAKIERKRVILNNAGTKECMVLKDPELVNQMVASNLLPALDEIPLPDGSKENTTAPITADNPTGSVTLNCEFVESELGAEFGKIVSTVRIVPNPTDNAGINGFKVFNIQSGSLLDKVGLQNGDVIQQVNDTNLSQPDQGFALFQALQDEESLRIKVLRQGETPVTLNVTINCK